MSSESSRAMRDECVLSGARPLTDRKRRVVAWSRPEVDSPGDHEHETLTSS